LLPLVFKVNLFNTLRLLLTFIYGVGVTFIVTILSSYNIYKWASPSGDPRIQIVNCKNTLNTDKLRDQCNCDDRWKIEGPSIIDSVMQSVFPQGKQKATATGKAGMITYVLYIDAATGAIVNVEFLLYRIQLSEEAESLPAVTIKEIYQLETRLKAQRFETCDCTQHKYGRAFITARL
jgi:predicted small secreted protein